MAKKQEIAVWNLQVPKPLDDALDKAIMANWHRTKAEFIRDAVREKLANMGLKEELETITQEAKT